MAYYTRLGKRNRITLLEIVILYYLTVVLFDTILVQSQMLLFNEIVINNAMIAIIAIVGIYSVLGLKLIRNGSIKKKYGIVLFFGVFSIIEILYYLVNKAGIYLVAIFVYKKIVPLLFVLAIVTTRKIIRLDRIVTLFKSFALINAVMTIVQYLTNELIWPFTTDSNGNTLFWSINSVDFSHLRPPGCMNSALSSGYISVIWLCLIIFTYRQGKTSLTQRKRLKLFASAIIAILAIFATQTRNIYLVTFFILIYCVVSNIAKNKKLIIMPVFSILSTVVYFVVFVFVLPTINGVIGLFSNMSSIIRVQNWIKLMELIKDESIIQKLMGIMKWQEIAVDSVFSDSLYMDLFFAMGFVGLIIYLFVNIKLQKGLLKYDLYVPIAALLASILFGGVANIPSPCYESTILILAAIFMNNYDRGMLDVKEKNKFALAQKEMAKE